MDREICEEDFCYQEGKKTCSPMDKRSLSEPRTYWIDRREIDDRDWVRRKVA